MTINNDGDGGAGISFYQPADMLLDTHVTALYPKNDITESVLRFISTCITIQHGKFGHGYSLNYTRLSVFRVMLPVREDNLPDWEFMENFVNQNTQQLKLEYLKKQADALSVFYGG